MSQENPLPQFLRDLDVFTDAYKSSVSMPQLSTDLKKFIVVHPQIKEKFQSYLDPESPLKVLNCLRLLEFLTINNKEQLLQIIQEEKFGDLFPGLMSLEERMDDILNLLKLWSETYGDCKTELEPIFNYINGLESFNITLPPRYQQKFELDDEYEPLQGPIAGPVTEMGLPYARLEDQVDDQTKKMADSLLNDMQSLLQKIPSLPLSERSDKIHNALHEYMMFKVILVQNMNPVTRIAMNGQLRLLDILKSQLEIYSMQTQMGLDIPTAASMNHDQHLESVEIYNKSGKMEIEERPKPQGSGSKHTRTILDTRYELDVRYEPMMVKAEPVAPKPDPVGKEEPVIAKELNGKLQSHLLVRTKYHEPKVLNEVCGMFPFWLAYAHNQTQKSE